MAANALGLSRQISCVGLKLDFSASLKHASKRSRFVNIGIEKSGLSLSSSLILMGILSLPNSYRRSYTPLNEGVELKKHYRICIH
jgi:hypothetical protein